MCKTNVSQAPSVGYTQSETVTWVKCFQIGRAEEIAQSGISFPSLNVFNPLSVFQVAKEVRAFVFVYACRSDTLMTESFSSLERVGRTDERVDKACLFSICYRPIRAVVEPCSAEVFLIYSTRLRPSASLSVISRVLKLLLLLHYVIMFGFFFKYDVRLPCWNQDFLRQWYILSD